MDLGYCASCLANYRANRELDAQRYELLVEVVAGAVDLGTSDPFVQDLLAAELINGLASEDYLDVLAIIDPTGAACASEKPVECR